MTEKQFKIFDAMAEPRSENAIRKAEERKEKRQQLKMKQINTIKSLCVDEEEGKVLGVWDIKDNPWGNILVGVDVYHNVFHEDELTKIENSNEGDITNDV